MEVPTIIDHILASFSGIVSQQDFFDVGLPDHQIFYCTWKISGMKRNNQKQIRRKKYSADIHEEVLVNYIFKITY